MTYKNLILSLLAIAALTACNDSTSYSTQLKEEETLITNFISRQGLTIVDTEPEQWGEKVYWKVPDYDNFYFHLVTAGDTASAEVETNDIINLRYTRYTLEAYADTMRMWTTDDSAYPVQFKYWTSDNNACTGWQVAVKYMKHSGAQCKIICPSKLGFDTENSSVIPYGYDMKIQIKRY